RLRRTGDGQVQQDSTAYGLFANATLHFLDERANLTLGARRSYDEKDMTSITYDSDNFIAQSGGFTAVSAKDDWQATDFRVTADYHVNDDIMLYATRSRAFRSGTFSVPAAIAPAAGRSYYLRPPLAPVPPELLYNNEVGMRSDWFDGRFRLNLTYYEMDLTNRQGASAVTDPTAPTGFVIQLVNQGDVELWGTEIEASF